MLDKTGSFRAAEVLTSGWCPLNCAYCYIPKSEYMKRLHKEIEEDLRSGKFIDRLESINNELTSLSFWGTEPTLTLPILEKWIPEIFVRFPKLEAIMFSTSLLAYPERIVNFGRALVGRNIRYEIQISVDGPSEITDKNRSPGGAERIKKNFQILVQELNKLHLGELKIQMMFKSTHSIENIKYLNSTDGAFDRYFDYFEDLFRIFDKYNKSENIALNRGGYCSTLVVPGKYTTEDGKEFAKYCREFHRRGKRTAYTHRLQRLFSYSEDIFKKRQFSCSGGDSNIGVENEYHICHRTYYLNQQGYVDSILSTDIENWDVSHFERGIIDFIRDNYIVSAEDFTRWQYVLRGYHDFWSFSLGSVAAMMKELALSNQVDEIYLYDDQLLQLFSIYINQALSCPMENLLNTGSIHIQILSMLRMFGNGAFQEIVRTL